MELYTDLKVSAPTLLGKLQPEEDVLTSSQERVLYYLKTFIRDVDNDVLQKLLHFVTGSGTCIIRSVKVAFNSTTGENRLPRASTCGNVLILSCQYDEYTTFKREFLAVLNSRDSFQLLST